MEGIKIEVAGNIAKVIEKPSRITSGTVGLPVEFTFDSQWDGLRKMAAFQAGAKDSLVDNITNETTVPWEVLETPGLRLNIGVYGVNEDGTIAISTIWVPVGIIQPGANPNSVPSAAPTLPIWMQLEKDIKNIYEMLAETPPKIAEVVLRASAWEGEDNLHSQVVNIENITKFSKVDLLPSVEQLAIFESKNVTFVTENEDGVVTVFAIGDKPTQNYTMQVSITEVEV